jgi:hypothetical protein
MKPPRPVLDREVRTWKFGHGAWQLKFRSVRCPCRATKPVTPLSTDTIEGECGDAPAGGVGKLAVL